MLDDDAGRPARPGRIPLLAACFTVLAALVAGNAVAGDKPDPMVARGKYLVVIGGCNDCHTQDYIFKNGQVDEKDWLLGNTVGWHGPWGTTYPPNLRLIASTMTADEFMKTARQQWRPPMPWFALREMTDQDVKAIYAYLRHLGPAGKPAPDALPPGATPQGPYFDAPKLPPPPAAAKGG